MNSKNNLTILFICTGNVFRSVCSKYIFEKKLFENNINNIKVLSAGISKNIGKRERQIDPVVKEELFKLNIDPYNHERKLVTQKMIDNSDIIITMTKKQKEYIEKNFNKQSILFNKICFSEDTDFLDEFEKYSSSTTQEEINNYLRECVKKINEGISLLFVNLIDN